MSEGWEFEEPEPVEASHLLRTWCSCGTETLAAPGWVRSARCAPCLARDTGGGVVYAGLPYSLPVGYPLGIAAQREVERVPHPAPEVSTRDPRPESVSEPLTVTDLAVYAGARGWAVTVAYSRGNGVHGTTGRPTALAEYWSVRFARGGYAGYAVRRDGTWHSVAVRGLELPPFLAMGITELKQWLEQPERPAQWYSDIVTRRAEQKAAARQSAKARPKKQRESGG